MSSNMLIKDLSFCSEITTEELTKIAGGDQVPVATTNTIEQGRARIRVDLRPGLKDKNFSGAFQSCSGTFDDFDGTLQLTCQLSPSDVNSGTVLFINIDPNSVE